jgi:hypothetical protein
MDWMNGFIDHSELHFTVHWHTQTSVLSLIQPPLAVSWQRLLPRESLSFPRLGPLVTAALAELLSTDNSTNWVPGWRPFHTNLLVFSSRADFQLTTDNWTLSLTNQLLYVTSLSWTADNSNQELLRCQVKVKVEVTLWLAVYRQNVRLGVKPLETHDQRYFVQLNSCGNIPYVTSSLTRRWDCLLWICLGFRQVYISHI